MSLTRPLPNVCSHSSRTKHSTKHHAKATALKLGDTGSLCVGNPSKLQGVAQQYRRAPLPNNGETNGLSERQYFSQRVIKIITCKTAGLLVRGIIRRKPRNINSSL